MQAQPTFVKLWMAPPSRRAVRAFVGAVALVGALVALAIEVDWLLAAEGGSRQVAGVCIGLGLLAMIVPRSRMATTSRIVGFAAVAVGFPAMTLTFIGESTPQSVDRVAAVDAIGTAVAASGAAFTAADTAVLIGSRDTAVAYAAASLAASLDSPLLLTSDMTLRGEVVEELERLGTRRAIVVGDAPSAHIERRLEWLGIAVTRMPGERDAAAASIALRMGSSAMLMLTDRAGDAREDAAAAASAIASGISIVWAAPDGIALETAGAILAQQPASVVVPSPTRAIREDLQRLGVDITTTLPVDHGPESSIWLAAGGAPMDVAVASVAAAARGADLLILPAAGSSGRAVAPQPLSRYAEVIIVGGTASVTEEMISART